MCFTKQLHAIACECHLAPSLLLYDSVPCPICKPLSIVMKITLLISPQCSNYRNSTYDRQTLFSPSTTSRILIFSYIKHALSTRPFITYEFDLMANKHPQDSVHTNTNKKEGEEERKSMTETQKEISEEEKFHYPLFWRKKITVASFLQRERRSTCQHCAVH